MNLLAHFYLATETGTSMAGQLLGDVVKGRLDGRFSPTIERGIRLHRAIDGFTDSHPVTVELRRSFEPPLRRYAGILVDIGFDYCLAQNWEYYSDMGLAAFADHAIVRARREWPQAAQATDKPPMTLARVLVDYRYPAGLQRALDSVDRRLRRASPLPHALPALLDQSEHLDTAFAAFFPQLCAYAENIS